jgi:hypothetical protein
MNVKAIVKELETLPPEAQQQVAEFITLLQARHAVPSRPVRRKGSIMGEPLFGLWKDRKDITDSVAYVRELHRRHMRG